MDRFCCVLRARLWFYLLLCVLQVTAAHAATRKYVSMPSDSDVVGSGRGSSVSGDLLNIPGNPIEGEYIPSSYGGGSKGTKLPVQPQYQYVKSRTIKGMIGTLKGGNIPAMGLTIGLQYMLDAVDGVIKDGSVMVPHLSEHDPLAKNWRVTGFERVGEGSSLSSACEAWAKAINRYIHSVELSTPTTGHCWYDSVNPPKKTFAVSGSRIKECPPETTVDPSNGACTTETLIPASDADFDLMEAAAAAKDSEWLKERLKEHCEGSIAPSKCYESLRDSVKLTGPASVQGPTQTTTGTYTKPDGTTGTTSSTTTTNYNIKYGNNYYDYSKTTTTTKSQDGQKVSEETTSESEEPVEEDKPQDDPVPCVANCDGPAYSDQYTPTDQTKEGVIDDYLSRVKAAPILSAGANFLTVSVGSSCPVWEVHHNMQILGATMPIDLVFDFHCLPWFVDFQPWAALVFAIVCAFGAFYIAILD